MAVPETVYWEATRLDKQQAQALKQFLQGKVHKGFWMPSPTPEKPRQSKPTLPSMILNEKVLQTRREPFQRSKKREASGHKSQSMMSIYNVKPSIVKPAKD
ncbi:MAG: hypothetical protein CTY19_08915 [Methylomonas sp.]|nr:MAG: hypothetical protein CTY19_08915 [Methylomonas sp.]